MQVNWFGNYNGLVEQAIEQFDSKHTDVELIMLALSMILSHMKFEVDRNEVDKCGLGIVLGERALMRGSDDKDNR